ncbi:MAG: phospholipid/cholesterol/gamma-HCH transport system permease protein [Acidobacteriota bacterium]|jgi:phospholipid/cholesterol/gamma-HCH transport system permease protein|nr:phospholipid/cholesterol/gamma-HCH transport system permease protein [Acidobacteriota bacterium]
MTNFPTTQPAIAVGVPADERTFLERVKEHVQDALFYIGGLTDLAVQTVQQTVRGRMERDIVMAQFDQIGVRSMSIVIITSLFIGMVLALQTAYSLAEFGGALFIGKVVSLSLVRELAPVLMSLMVGGRVGAGITAEIGTMKVTEQIDALRALATNPVRKLVVPRVLATTLMLPLMTILACFVGILGGLIIAVGSLHLSANFYTRSVIETLRYNDIASGVGKTFFFGFGIGLIACYNGLRTSGGADGVGRATTATVVTASITVLIMDFFLTKLFLFLF